MYITISVTLVYLYTYILIYFLLPTIRTSKLSMTYAVLYIILISNTYVVLCSSIRHFAYYQDQQIPLQPTAGCNPRLHRPLLGCRV